MTTMSIVVPDDEDDEASTTTVGTIPSYRFEDVLEVMS